MPTKQESKTKQKTKALVGTSRPIASQRRIVFVETFNNFADSRIVNNSSFIWADS
jgi:hypothetical protein